MSRLITHADVAALPDGSTLTLPPDAQLTPLAQERAAARGIQLVYGAADNPVGGQVIGREARSAAVIDREARSAAVIDREARSAAVIDRVVSQVVNQVVSRLGGADRDLIDKVVQEVLGATGLGGSAAPAASPAYLPPGGEAPSSADYCAAYLEQERARSRRRAVITTTGKNQRGVVARLTTTIAELGGDILDLSQTLVGDYFTMLLVVDTAQLGSTFSAFKAAIETVAAELGLHAMIMHEDILTALQRV